MKTQLPKKANWCTLVSKICLNCGSRFDNIKKGKKFCNHCGNPGILVTVYGDPPEEWIVLDDNKRMELYYKQQDVFTNESVHKGYGSNKEWEGVKQTQWVKKDLKYSDMLHNL